MGEITTSSRTQRLVLSRPEPTDVEGMFALCSDPRLWTHFPSLRHTSPAQTAAMLEAFMDKWVEDEIGPWVIRLRGEDRIIGQGGCSLKNAAFWNLGYRFAHHVQGQGLATELSLEAVRQAQAHNPELPVVAYLLEHNTASARVAQKVGLTLMHRGPDAGNPDPHAIRLVYADRPINEEQLAIIMQ